MILSAAQLKDAQQKVFRQHSDELSGQLLFDLFINPLLQLSILNSQYSTTDKKPKNFIEIDTIPSTTQLGKRAIQHITGFPQYSKLNDDIKVKVTNEITTILSDLGYHVEHNHRHCNMKISW